MFLLDTYAFDAKVADVLGGATAIFEAGESSPLTVALVLDPYTPSKLPNPDDIIYASFTGSTPLDTAASGPVTRVLDSGTKRVGYLMNEPTGGFRWICTVAPVTPQVVVAVVITNVDDTIWFSGLLDVPKTITDAGDFIELSGLLGYFQANLFAPLT